MIEIREVSPADEPGFAAWHEALSEGTLDGRVAASVASLSEFVTSLGAPGPARRRLAVAAFDVPPENGPENRPENRPDDRRCVGAMLFEMPLQADLDVVEVEIAVPPAHRGAGVASALWEWAVACAGAEGRSVFQSEIHVPTGHTFETWPGTRFAAARGFVSANVEDHLVVDLPFDAERLAALEAAAPSGDGYRIEAWSGPCPEHHAEAWAMLRTAMSADVPTGELTRQAVVHNAEALRTSETRRDRSWVALSSLALTDEGEAVGYSTLLVPRTRPEHAQQDDTLVVREHRGRGLATRLKTANLRALEQEPTPGASPRRWLHTYTEQGNVAMQRVNARFGFRRVEVLHEVERRGAERQG